MIIFWRVMENVTGFVHDANYLTMRRTAAEVGFLINVTSCLLARVKGNSSS